MKRFMIPLFLFVVLLGFLAWGLKPGYDPHEVPSPLIGKPAPAFLLKQVDSNAADFSPEQMKGKVWLLNVWSSWCVSCREEHPVLLSLSKTGAVPIYGLNYKEVRGDGGFKEPDVETPESNAAELALGRRRAEAWLSQHGNPYVLTAMDITGRVGIDYGVYGVPESFLIDKAGVIRYKQIGPITEEALRDKILPLVRELQL